MSTDGRRPGDLASGQVEDRFAGGDGGFAAGSEGGGSEVWEKEPAVPGGWEIFGTRGGEREAARRRVEAHPEVMPPHPRPNDRAEAKKRVEASSLAMQAVPVALLFMTGLLLPRLFARPSRFRFERRVFGRRTTGPVVQVALRSRNRRDAMHLAELLHGQRFRGELVFE